MSQAPSVLTTPLVSTRDTDWAIHGGIANGLAGPGAGLATAMNIQRQNAENRARADAINSAYVSSLVRSGALEKAAQAEKNIKMKQKSCKHKSKKQKPLLSQRIALKNALKDSVLMGSELWLAKRVLAALWQAHT